MVRTRDLANGALIGGLVVVTLLALPRLPGELAVRFTDTGEVGAVAETPTFVSMWVAMTAVVAALFAGLPRIDPLGDNVAAFQRTYDVTAVGTVVFMAYVYGLVLAVNLGLEVGVVQATVPAVAGLYLLLALLLWRAERNWFVGIRTPWTLSDERVWDRTHRVTAPLFVVAAVVSLGALLAPAYTTLFLAVPVTLVVVVAVVYSAVLYRRLEGT